MRHTELGDKCNPRYMPQKATRVDIVSAIPPGGYYSAADSCKHHLFPKTIDNLADLKKFNLCILSSDKSLRFRVFCHLQCCSRSSAWMNLWCLHACQAILSAITIPASLHVFSLHTNWTSRVFWCRSQWRQPTGGSLRRRQTVARFDAPENCRIGTLGGQTMWHIKNSSG